VRTTVATAKAVPSSRRDRMRSYGDVMVEIDSKRIQPFGLERIASVL
jgi:hypothetical protein